MDRIAKINKTGKLISGKVAKVFVSAGRATWIKEEKPEKAEQKQEAKKVEKVKVSESKPKKRGRPSKK